MRRSRAALVVTAMAASAMLLSGCGFQLQGRARLPALMAVVRVDASDAQSDFVQELQRALRASGAKLSTDPREAATTLRIERDELSQRVLSVSSRNIPAEYELTYSVRFSVRTGIAESLPAEDIAVSREFSFDESKLLAKQREQDLLREALARDLVGMVMRRLSTL